jgi:hypothetical protein
MSVETSSTTSSLTTTTQSMATAFPTIPIHHAVTIKLTQKNFFLWRAQLLPYLRSTNLLGYLDGSLPAPPMQVASSIANGAELQPNPRQKK